MSRGTQTNAAILPPVGRPTEDRMVGVGGGEVVLLITGVQKTKKEKAKILPADGADS